MYTLLPAILCAHEGLDKYAFELNDSMDPTVLFMFDPFRKPERINRSMCALQKMYFSHECDNKTEVHFSSRCRYMKGVIFDASWEQSIPRFAWAVNFTLGGNRALFALVA